MAPAQGGLERLEDRVLLASLSPDDSFGGDGEVHVGYTGSYAEEARAVALQPDGKVVVAGRSEGNGFRLLLARLKPNGSLDRSFGERGIAQPSVGIGEPHDVVVQRDGKILLAGSGASELTVVRLNADGSIDTGFGGGDGIASVTVLSDPVQRFGVANSLHLLKDGRILVAGTARWKVGGHSDIVVARLNGDGSPDESFGGGDGLTHAGLKGHQYGHDVTTDPDGRIVVSGASGSSAAIVRFTAKGGFDRAFAKGGIVTFPLRAPSKEGLHAVWAGKNRIVATGRGDEGVMVVGVDAGGKPVASFGRDGRRDYRLHRGWDVGREVLPRGKGRFTVVADTQTRRAGGGENPQRAGTYLLHFNADGKWDTAAGGKVRLRLLSGGHESDQADAVRTPDGSFIVAANDVHRTMDIRVMRVDTEGKPDASYAKGRGARIDVRGPLKVDVHNVWHLRDGKLLVAAGVDHSEKDRLLVRLNPDGSVDESFGDDGRVTFGWPGGYEWYWSIFRFAEQSNGRILLAAQANGGGDVAVMRLNADGSRDGGFGDGGLAVIDDLHRPELFAVLPDGDILIGGGDGAGELPHEEWHLRRLKPNGSIDSSFAADFRLRDYHEFRHVLVESDGGVLLVGATADVVEDWSPHEGPSPTNQRLTIVRLKADGSIDTSFGADGVRRFEQVPATHALGVERRKGGGLQIATGWDEPQTGAGTVSQVRTDAAGRLEWSSEHEFRSRWRDWLHPSGDIFIFREEETIRIHRDGSTQTMEPVMQYYNVRGIDDAGRVYEVEQHQQMAFDSGFVVRRYVIA